VDWEEKRIFPPKSSTPQARNHCIELQSGDLRVFDSLEGCFKKLEAAMKSFAKRGKQKAAQEKDSDNED
jgi:hypothetical protein